MIAPAALVVMALAIFIMKMPSFEESSPKVGDLAPELQIADLSGRMISLSDYRGSVVLVNFWASWCPPCRDEMRWFQTLYKEFGDSGFNVVAIATDQVKPEDASSLGVDFPLAIANDRVKDAYGGATNVPVSFLIGSDGRVIRKLRKVYEEQELRADLVAALMQAR